MLEEYVGEKIVVDLKSPYVCLGTLSRIDAAYIEIKNADFHDLRDSDTSRENYVAASVVSGLKRNRKKILLAINDIVAVSKLADVSDG